MLLPFSGAHSWQVLVLALLCYLAAGAAAHCLHPGVSCTNPLEFHQPTCCLHRALARVLLKVALTHRQLLHLHFLRAPPQNSTGELDHRELTQKLHPARSIAHHRLAILPLLLLISSLPCFSFE